MACAGPSLATMAGRRNRIVGRAIPDDSRAILVRPRLVYKALVVLDGAPLFDATHCGAQKVARRYLYDFSVLVLSVSGIGAPATSRPLPFTAPWLQHAHISNRDHRPRWQNMTITGMLRSGLCVPCAPGTQPINLICMSVRCCFVRRHARQRHDSHTIHHSHGSRAMFAALVVL